MNTTVEIRKQKIITAQERLEMYDIFSRYYENTTLSKFENDLHAKDWIIILRDEKQQIQGFSTLLVYEYYSVKLTKSIRVIYSGDTIIEKAYRNTMKLACGFSHFLLKMIEASDNIPLYWLLSSKGVRTYRVLPVYFHIFYPAYNQKAIPSEIKSLIDELAFDKYGSNYNPDTQVVSHFFKNDRLCFSDQISPTVSRKNLHVNFFIKRNPEFVNGDELICLTPITKKNMNSTAYRVIKNSEVSWYE